jgi:hypothetical protein
MVDVPIVFVTSTREPPGLELRINFGMFAGREATPAELEELGARLLSSRPSVSIVSEQRHEIGPHVEASLHQVRVELGDEAIPADDSALERLERQLVTTAEEWARGCAAERHAEVTEL